MTKVIKLLANLSTEEEVAIAAYKAMPELTSTLIEKICIATDKRSIERNEEFILNAISCVTNILYYDRAGEPLISHELRCKVFHSFKDFLLATQNEEIQIETVRVLSNLSRHREVCVEIFAKEE